MKYRIDKTRLFSRLVFAAVVAIFLTACEKESRLTQENVPISGQIKGIIVDGPWEVVVTQDTVNSSVLLEYSESERDRISAKLLPSGYLHLKISSWGNMHNKIFRAKVSAAWLEKIQMSGAAKLRTFGFADIHTTFPANVIDISLSGASHLSSFGLYRILGTINIALSGASTINHLFISGNIVNAKILGASNLDFVCNCNNLNAEISGASELCLWSCAGIANLYMVDCSGASTFSAGGNGTVLECSFTGSGASHFKTLNLETDFLDVDLSGASNAEVNVNNAITGSLTGASTLKYRNVPDVSGVSADISSKIIRLK